MADMAVLTLKIASGQAEQSANRMNFTLNQMNMTAIRVENTFNNVSNHIVNDMRKIDNTAKRVSASVKTSFDRVGRTLRNVGIGMTATLSAPIVLFGKSALEAASNAQEIQSAFDVTFKNIRNQATMTAEQVAKDLDLARSTSVKLFKQIGDQLTGVDFSQSNALSMSEDVIRLAADLASFQNIAGGTEDVVNRLTKAMLGETEGLKAVGVVIRQDSKEFKNAVKQTMAMTGATELQAKSQVIFKMAVNQSKNAIGDYARTADSYANRVRALEQSWLTLKEAIGTAIVPTALQIVNKLISAVQWLTDMWGRLSEPVKKFIIYAGGITAILGPVLAAIGLMVILIAPIAVVALKVVAAILLIAAAVELVRRYFGITWKEIGLGLLEFARYTIGFVINFRKNWQLLTDWFKANWQNMIIDAVSNFLIFQRNIIKNMAVGINLLSGIIGAFTGWFADNWELVLGQILETMTQWINNALDLFYNFGSKVMENIKNGITGSSQVTLDPIGSFVDGMTETGTLAERIQAQIDKVKFVGLTEGFQNSLTDLPKFITDFDFFNYKALSEGVANAIDTGDDNPPGGGGTASTKLASALEAGSTQAFKLLSGSSTDNQGKAIQKKNTDANVKSASMLDKIFNDGIKVNGLNTVSSIR